MLFLAASIERAAREAGERFKQDEIKRDKVRLKALRGDEPRDLYEGIPFDQIKNTHLATYCFGFDWQRDVHVINKYRNSISNAKLIEVCDTFGLNKDIPREDMIFGVASHIKVMARSLGLLEVRRSSFSHDFLEPAHSDSAHQLHLHSFLPLLQPHLPPLSCRCGITSRC